jgi:hypothetical protein
MKRAGTHRSSGIGVGGASIVMVFSVLCLTIFAVLSLVTARNAFALSTRAAGAVTDYYAADGLAVEIYDALSASDAMPESVLGVTLCRVEEDCMSYRVPIDENQELCVLLRREGADLRILEWSVHSTGEWNPSDRILVWDGAAPSDY